MPVDMTEQEEQEQQEEAFADYEKVMREDAAQQQHQWDETMNAVKQEMGEAWYDELIEYLEFEDCYFNPKFVEQTKGNHQTIDGELIKEEWVDQTTNGGFTGDEFAGTIYFKITESKYLEFNYSM